MAKIRKNYASTVINIASPKLPVEKVTRQDFNTEWVPYFKDDSNIFPNDLAKRAKRSSTHASIIETKLDYTIGNGFEFMQNDRPYEDAAFLDYIQSINANNETFEDIYAKAARDYIIIGAFSLELNRVNNRLNTYHRDVTNVRSGKAIDNRINNYFLSTDWVNIKLDRRSNDGEPMPIQAYKFGIKGKSLLYVKDYTPEHFYYGLPDYIGALDWIDIEYRIPKFNLEKFDNGFMPSALIQLFGQPPEGMSPEEYVSSINSSWTGEGNAKKFLIQILESKEQAANVQLFNEEISGDFQKMQDLAIQNIITAHGWSPYLSGIQVSGLGDSGNKIRTDYERVMNTIITGYQNKLNRAFERILKDAGWDVKIKNKQKKPTTLSTNVSINDFNNLFTNVINGNVDPRMARELSKIVLGLNNEEVDILIPEDINIKSNEQFSNNNRNNTL